MKGWLKKLGASLLSLGPWGLLAAAFIDSSFLPLPEFVDVGLISACLARPAEMWLYAAVTTLGSLAGCLVLFYVARLAGHAFAERMVGKERMARIRGSFEKYELLTIMVPALLPLPIPFKAFVITAGVLEVHIGTFLLALVAGRSLRYFGEAYLAVHYGQAVWRVLHARGTVLGIFVAVCLAVWLVVRVVRRQRIGRLAGSNHAV